MGLEFEIKKGFYFEIKNSHQFLIGEFSNKKLTKNVDEQFIESIHCNA